MKIENRKCKNVGIISCLFFSQSIRDAWKAIEDDESEEEDSVEFEGELEGERTEEGERAELQIIDNGGKGQENGEMVGGGEGMESLESELRTAIERQEDEEEERREAEAEEREKAAAAAEGGATEAAAKAAAEKESSDVIAPGLHYRAGDEPEPIELTHLNVEAAMMCLASKVRVLCGRADSPTLCSRTFRFKELENRYKICHFFKKTYFITLFTFFFSGWPLLAPLVLTPPRLPLPTSWAE